jgi:hypothetical protein
LYARKLAGASALASEVFDGYDAAKKGKELVDTGALGGILFPR